uniref:ATP synthase complex subunit 8 n=1 Tax=Hypotermes makhamensis TaxID=229714 RepID=A0A1S5VLK1_9NEOP|nr:ATP synthase F0 subunit 8 [Hypotermes makhamensis]AQP26839.1 ATP synthase F0 subunit 8 [Hypotermes makhamensis]
MPQMMPMEWMILYTVFLTSFMLFNIMNYFNQPPKPKTTDKTNINTDKVNWKW